MRQFEDIFLKNIDQSYFLSFFAIATLIHCIIHTTMDFGDAIFNLAGHSLSNVLKLQCSITAGH